MTRLPTFDVRRTDLVRAIVAALVLGVVGGVVIAVLGPALLYQVAYLDVIAIAGLGYGVGEGVSVSVNRKRGRTLKYVAAGGMVVAYAIVIFFGVSYLTPLDPFTLLAAGLGVYAAVSRF